jgi:membrane protein implicated in regulation of membrane protease activity
MPYWMNLENFRVFAMVCAGNVALAAVIGGLGFVFMLARAKGLWRSMSFGGSVLFLPLLMPAFACTLTIMSFLITRSFVAEATMTTGEVVDLARNSSSEGGDTFSAIVTFTTADGQTITFEDNSKTCDPPCNQIGDQVPVRYRPNSTTDTKDAIISGGIDIWLATGVMALLLVVFLPVSLIIAWSSYRNKDWSANAQSVAGSAIGY